MYNTTRYFKEEFEALNYSIFNVTFATPEVTLPFCYCPPGPPNATLNANDTFGNLTSNLTSINTTMVNQTELWWEYEQFLVDLNTTTTDPYWNDTCRPWVRYIQYHYMRFAEKVSQEIWFQENI